MIAETQAFESWYQKTLAPIAEQLGIRGGKEMIKKLFETKFNFEFVGISIESQCMQNAAPEIRRAEA